MKNLCKPLLELAVILDGPFPRGVPEIAAFVVRHGERRGHGLFQRDGIDEEIPAEVARFGGGVFDQEAAVGPDQFVHRRAVGGDDEGFAAHRFHNVVTPALRAGGSEMDGMLVDEMT